MAFAKKLNDVSLLRKYGISIQSLNQDVLKNKSSRRDKEDRSRLGGVRDVLGKHDYANVRKRDKSNPIKHKYRKSPLALSHFNKLKSHYGDKEKQMITEVDKIEEELNGKKIKTKKK